MTGENLDKIWKRIHKKYGYKNFTGEPSFEVEIRAFLSSSKRKHGTGKTKADIGLDLDNIIKNVIDSLGPLIGYKQSHTGKRPNLRDDLITKIRAEKQYGGFNPETVTILVKKFP